jgi:uncharacterized protein YjbI with pentapeptide repeats
VAILSGSGAKIGENLYLFSQRCFMDEEKDRLLISGEELGGILKTGIVNIRIGNKREEWVFQDILEEKPNIIYVEDIIIDGRVYLSEVDLRTTSISFKNVTFLSDVYFEHTTYSSISFTSCEVLKETYFLKAFINIILFRNTKLHTLDLEAIKRSKISLENISCKQVSLFESSCRLYVSNGEVGFLAAWNSELPVFQTTEVQINDLKIETSNCEFFLIKSSCLERIRLLSDLVTCQVLDSKIKHLTIRSSFQANPIISNSTIEELVLAQSDYKKMLLTNNVFDQISLTSDITRESLLLIAESQIKNNLSFQTIKNFGHLQLVNLNLLRGTDLNLHYSDLGKTDFINNDFSSAKFIFSNSKVSECFLAETDFPKEVYSRGQISYHQAQLVFGQLQTAYQRQGDNVRASEYQAREIEAHYKTLPWSRKNFFTKLNLFFNWISNNFGRNWAQGAFFSISIGLFFFYCLVLSSEEFHFALNFSHIPNLLDSFLKFMNPLRHFETENLFQDKQPVVNATPGTYILDFAGRIFVTYGYYQTIQAFRRFGKR